MQLCRRKYKRVKKTKFNSEKECKLRNRGKDDRFINDYSTKTANQYFRSLAEYWKDGTYSKTFINLKDKKKEGSKS